MRKTVRRVSRRVFLAGAAGALAAPMVLKATRVQAKTDAITVTGYGGSAQEAVVKLVANPFSEETGIKVTIVPTPDVAKLKAQLLTGNVEIDVFDTSTEVALYASRQGFFEKLDVSVFDVEDLAAPPQGDAVGIMLSAAGIAWNPERFSSGKHPKNFPEYFDVKAFPGRRTLRNAANGTLEAALLADGVTPKNIYPLDVDRALKSLDRIKPSVASWFTAVPQSISLVQTGEVDFSYSWANRVKNTNLPGGGTPLSFSFDQNLLSVEVMAVPKGAPNRENAVKFIAYFLRPEVQARVCDAIGTTPNSKKGISMLPAEARKWVADTSSSNNLFLNGSYWADNLEPVSRRFKEWVLS